jgi:hypothetical protein
VATCPYCFEAGSLIRTGFRQSAAIDAVPEVTTAHALAMASWSLVECAPYPALRIGRGSLSVVFGAPGNGKSTFATKMLNGLRGPVVYQSVEEAVGPSLHDRLARCGVRRNDFYIVGRASVDQLADVVRTRQAVGLAVDSVQMAAFTPEELRHLLIVLPELQTIVAVAQVNAKGVIEGRNRLAHEADLVVSCEAMDWVVTKSRYQMVGINGRILAQSEAQ